MFGRKNVMQRVVSSMEERLTEQGDQIIEDHATLVKLTTQNKHLADMVEGLCNQVDAIKARQDQLREGLFDTLTHDKRNDGD